MENNNLNIDKLRVNSRFKHLILSDYLPTWASILGTYDKTLNYFDCFAGPGEYVCNGARVDGSPVIAINECKKIILSGRTGKPNIINLAFMENDLFQQEKLQKSIKNIGDIPKSLRVTIMSGDSESITKKIVSNTKSLAPSFFFIDPYSHPFPLTLMHKIMSNEKTEIMVNFMYYQIIRDIDNPYKEPRCLKLFAPDDPKKLDLKTNDKFDENKILKYLASRIRAKYYIPFRVNFGPDEDVTSNKLKYFLIHYSNSFKAFDLMLTIMWKHSDLNKPLMVADGVPILFPLKDLSDLKNKILVDYKGCGLRISFNDFVEKNWLWYYRETHYRTVLKKLENENIISVDRVTSKTERGLRGDDIIIFPEVGA